MVFVVMKNCDDNEQSQMWYVNYGTKEIGSYNGQRFDLNTADGNILT